MFVANFVTSGRSCTEDLSYEGTLLISEWFPGDIHTYSLETYIPLFMFAYLLIVRNCVL